MIILSGAGLNNHHTIHFFYSWHDQHRADEPATPNVGTLSVVQRVRDLQFISKSVTFKESLAIIIT